MSFVYISRQYDVVTNVPNILTSKKKGKKKEDLDKKRRRASQCTMLYLKEMETHYFFLNAHLQTLKKIKFIV